MFRKLEEVERKFERLGQELQEPGVANDQRRYRGLMQEYANLEKVVLSFREYKKLTKDIKGNKELLDNENDEELRRLVKSDLAALEKEGERLEQELKILLLPKDPNDEKNIVLEIRAGAGGDEASLFAEQLFRAYTLYASLRGWKVAAASISPGNVGGYKEVIATISGDKVYSLMKYESGVHRVQRVPKTEAQGRIHTSTVTVAVIPEADEIDIKINPVDLRVDTMRASGAGGQSVNRTESAIRITHIPSGIMVACQEEKSQLSNRHRAMQILYAKLLAREEEKARKDASDARLAQIGTGDRSERIRTYNYPQSRITDHRIGFTTHQLSDIMDGRFELIIEPVVTHFQAEELKRQTTQ
ncbi:MAG: peptide chain release factor 1 [Bdellovibrionales bacterium RBG_16_40_8]|nr:MAG: peptide chain release factor 1 [Bdellovibrionales bacterium RBG_16_40_8]